MSGVLLGHAPFESGESACVVAGTSFGGVDVCDANRSARGTVKTSAYESTHKFRSLDRDISTRCGEKLARSHLDDLAVKLAGDHEHLGRAGLLKRRD